MFEKAKRTKKLSAFITVTGTAALEARRVEAEIARGAWKGPLNSARMLMPALIALHTYVFGTVASLLQRVFITRLRYKMRG